MADSPMPPLDRNLERASKAAGIFVPIVVALVGWRYTYLKDHNDQIVNARQAQIDSDQKKFDNTQKQYTNLSALLPLLTSDDEFKAKVALEVFISEAQTGQAPLDLKPTILGIPDRFPHLTVLSQTALTAASQQQGVTCSANPAGVYLQVANSDAQLTAGRALVERIGKLNIQPPVQGVQRIDKGPAVTQLRYYFSPTNDSLAARMIPLFNKAGITSVQTVDLSHNYLKPGCTPPAVFELWIGTSTPLTP